MFFGHLAIASMAAFFASILFESPFIGLEKLAFQLAAPKKRDGPRNTRNDENQQNGENQQNDDNRATDEKESNGSSPPSYGAVNQAYREDEKEQEQINE